ncbi:cytochrome c4 ['Osedax' symbiont bacterium Rs2_46_30_T18]|nr:cytochrome c4 ['Osedax' symbiont bacterium Rs2_46_30_T18]
MNKILIGLVLSLSASTYAYAAGDAAAGKEKAVACGACHAADGNSEIGNFPKLAGQNAKYLIKQMVEIQSGARSVPEMAGQLDGKNEQDLEDLAAYFSSKKILGGKTAADQLELGQSIYRSGIPAKQVAACTACHGAKGQGLSTAGFPALGGQHAAYTQKQLQSFRTSLRDNDTNGMMRDIAARLSDVEIKAVSSYIQGLY